MSTTKPMKRPCKFVVRRKTSSALSALPRRYQPVSSHHPKTWETLADFEGRYRAAVEVAEEYKRSKERISRTLEDMSGDVKDWEGKI